MVSPTPAKVTPFYTFDAIDGVVAGPVMSALEAGDEATWSRVLADYPDLDARLREEGADPPAPRAGIDWDDGTLFFVSTIARDTDGSPAAPLDRGHSRERLGRVPHGDGNPMAYLCHHLVVKEEDSPLGDLLDLLASRLTEAHRGHNRLQIALGGMDLRGWLSDAEASELRAALQKHSWGPASDEPIDGGVRDITRHLLVLLKSAEKRGHGLLFRAHA